VGLVDKLFRSKKKTKQPLEIKGGLPKFEAPPMIRQAADKKPPQPQTQDLDIDLSMIEEGEKSAAAQQAEGQKPPQPAPKPAEKASARPAPEKARAPQAGPRPAEAKAKQAPAQPRAAAPSAGPEGRTVSMGKRRGGYIRRRTSETGRLIGNLLVANDSITEKQLANALSQQQKSGGLVGQILVEQGACTKAHVANALNKQRTITTVDLEQAKFDQAALNSMTRSECVRLRSIPFEKIGRLICLAMSNVLDGSAKAELREITRAKIKTFDAAWPAILAAIEKNYPEEQPEEEPQEKEAGAEAAELDLGGEEPSELEIELPEEAATRSETAPKEAPQAPRHLVAVPVSREYWARAAAKGVGMRARWLAECAGQVPLPAQPAGQGVR